MTTTTRISAALAVSACLVLSACSGDSEGDAGDEATTPTSTPSPTPSPSVTQLAGVELTAPGTTLPFGSTATVEYSPNQKVDSVLSLTVKDATRGRLSDLRGFDLDTPYKRNAHYYFVNVSVENAGDAEVGGRDVPLNGVNEANMYLPPVVFESAFPKCPTEQLPRKFGQGDRFNTCLVFLAPGKGRLTAVSTLPGGTLDPVTWTGDVKPPPQQDKKKNG